MMMLLSTFSYILRIKVEVDSTNESENSGVKLAHYITSLKKLDLG